MRRTQILTVLIILFLINSLFAWSVSFNSPPKSGNLKSSLVDLLLSAKSTIFIAIYNLSDPDIIRILKEKSMEGINVKLVMEGKNYLSHLNMLKELNIVADPLKGGLMHEKFVVVDDRRVWIGSANFTHSSFYLDFNNAIILNSSALAFTLDKEFNLMRKGYFSSSKIHEATTLVVEKVKADIRFSPKGDVFKEIIKNLKSAKKEVYIAIYAFSDPRIALLLMALDERGIKVKVLADDEWNRSSYSILPKMREFGFFKPYDNPYGLLHDKYMIIDPHTSNARVITGSYNLTRSAQKKNDEIIVVFHSKKIADIYLENFELLCGPLLNKSK